ncbi:MAG TPA: response regulator transcription factor [Cyclobacteriaceae bacterium]
MQIRLAIVDDEIRLAKNLKSDLLEFAEIESVVTCNSGLKFATELEQMHIGKRPEVIIMDISMGSPDEGVQATRLIKSKFPEIEIIIFSISDEDERVFEAFKAGAMGYLLKSEPPSFILKTILDVKSGGAQMSPMIARKAIRFFLPAQPEEATSEPSPEPRKLSMREMEILGHVSKGLTYHHISELLFISPNTVKKHMVNIFEKLHVKNKIEALKAGGF